MKREVPLYFLIAAFVIYSFIETNSSIAFISSGFTISAALAFLIFNATRAYEAVREHGWSAMRWNVMLFAIVYVVALTLNVMHWVDISRDADFSFSYLFRGFPHERTALLPVLYAAGWFFGYLRRNRRALRITMFALAGIILLSLSIYFMPVNYADNNLQEVEYLEGRYQTIEEIIELPQFRDKTVYIDLWHTGCQPCFVEFRDHLPALKEQFGPDELTYLYLAKEVGLGQVHSKHRWEKAIDKFGLTGWHYIFPKEDESLLWEDIKANVDASIYGYPHHLIARNGQIISYDAPGPADRKQLSELIAD